MDLWWSMWVFAGVEGLWIAVTELSLCISSIDVSCGTCGTCGTCGSCGGACRLDCTPHTSTCIHMQTHTNSHHSPSLDVVPGLGFLGLRVSTCLNCIYMISLLNFSHLINITCACENAVYIMLIPCYTLSFTPTPSTDLQRTFNGQMQDEQDWVGLCRNHMKSQDMIYLLEKAHSKM